MDSGRLGRKKITGKWTTLFQIDEAGAQTDIKYGSRKNHTPHPNKNAKN